MGRKKIDSSQASCEFTFGTHGLENLESSYPTLLKVAGSRELPLLDLSSIQMELEQILASVVERMICLQSESKGKELPASVVSAIKRHHRNREAESNQKCLSKPSLVVKANPDKPLTLIISQRSGPCPNPQTTLPSVSTSVKPAFGLRRSSRSSVEEVSELCSPASPDKTLLTSSYVIPNKFWELMEPYCAEITEANVSYLEGLIRSYQQLESIYFHLPVLKQNEACKQEAIEAPVQKRLRRDFSQITQQTTIDDTLYASNKSHSFMAATQMLYMNKYLEMELKKPIPESSMLCKISQSLLESCYQNDVLTSIHEKLHLRTHKANPNNEVEDNCSACTDPSGSDYGSVSTEALHINGVNDGGHSSNNIHSQVNQSSSGSGSINRNLSIDPNTLTSLASQPLKSIAKQFRVSSSYRVEKKIAQAIEELGLFPLSILHPKVSPPVDCKEDRGSHKSPSTALFNGPASHSTKLIIRKNKTTSSTSNKSDVQTSPDRSPISKKRCIIDERTISPLPETACNTVSNSVDYLDDENPTEEGLHVKTEDIHINPIDGSDKVRSPWHTKRSNQKKLKSPKSIRYKNRLRNIVNNNNNNNKTDLLCNGLSPSRNDSILSKKSDCLPNLYADQRLLNADTECYNGTNDYLLRHEQDIDVSLPFSPRRRNTFPAHLLSDNERRSSESIGGLTNLHQPSLWHDQFSPNHLSVSNCNGDTKLLADYSEKHKSLLMNGDSSLSQVHNENLIEHNLSRDKLNLSCNSLHEDYERSQVLEFSSLQNNDLTTTPLHNCRLKPKTECSWMEESNKTTDHITGKTSLQISTSMQNNDIKSTDDDVLPSHLQNPMFNTDTGSPTQYALCGDDIGWAIIQRQRELRFLCTSNHRVLRRLVQAARRDMQRQEIQRRLAIADADVIEAYNKLESYRPQRRPPLKRDRDMAWKALKERRKILKELEAFDAKSP